MTVSRLRMQTLTRYVNTANLTYDALASGVWSNVELNVGVICICMPVFRRFFAQIFLRFFISAKDTILSRGEGEKPEQTPPSGK